MASQNVLIGDHADELRRPGDLIEVGDFDVLAVHKVQDAAGDGGSGEAGGAGERCVGGVQVHKGVVDTGALVELVAGGIAAINLLVRVGDTNRVAVVHHDVAVGPTVSEAQVRAGAPTESLAGVVHVVDNEHAVSGEAGDGPELIDVADGGIYRNALHFPGLGCRSQLLQPATVTAGVGDRTVQGGAVIESRGVDDRHAAVMVGTRQEPELLVLVELRDSLHGLVFDELHRTEFTVISTQLKAVDGHGNHVALSLHLILLGGLSIEQGHNLVPVGDLPALRRRTVSERTFKVCTADSVFIDFLLVNQVLHSCGITCPDEDKRAALRVDFRDGGIQEVLSNCHGNDSE